jgi:hypothetical protein
LNAPEVKDVFAQIVHAAQKRSTMTLIYGAKEHNEAVVLQPVFKRATAKLGKRNIAKEDHVNANPGFK